MRLFVLLVSAVLCSPSTAQKTMPLSDIERLEQLEKVIANFENLRAATDQLSNGRYMGCMKAFGEPNFCECLKSKLPVVTTFQGYINITTRGKEENMYSVLSKEDKKVYDRAVQVRDICVAARKQ